MVIDSLKKNGLFSGSPFFLYQYLPGMLLWIIFTIPSLKLFSKTSSYAIGKRIPLLLAMGGGIGILKNIFSWLIYFVFMVSEGRFPATLDSLGTFLSRLNTFYFVEAAIIAIVMLIVFYIIELNKNYKLKSIEASQLESQLAKAQLESLRMQLQPHFLFNAHNTVSMLIRTKQYVQATEMISKISELLRNSLKSEEAQFVPLSRELELIKAYLEIEEVRFEDHLTISFDLDQNAENDLVPHLLLQPLIENAFKHGISKNLGASNLQIKTVRNGDIIRLTVHNTGPGLPEGWHQNGQSGIGLSNIQQRLSKLYEPGNFKFDIFNEADGVTATLQLPIKEQAVE